MSQESHEELEDGTGDQDKAFKAPPRDFMQNYHSWLQFQLQNKTFLHYMHIALSVHTDISTHQVTTISVWSTYLYTYAMKTIWWEAIQYKRDYRKLEVIGVYITEQLGKLI